MAQSNSRTDILQVFTIQISATYATSILIIHLWSILVLYTSYVEYSLISMESGRIELLNIRTSSPKKCQAVESHPTYRLQPPSTCATAWAFSPRSGLLFCMVLIGDHIQMTKICAADFTKKRQVLNVMDFLSPCVQVITLWTIVFKTKKFG